jgi:predicted GNAT family acetyltransferase
MQIDQFDRENKGFFKAEIDGEVAGRMTYSRAGNDKIIIDHTEVYPAYNGKGVGKELVMAAVDFAREHNLKIIPLCPYAKRVFERTEAIRDVLA